MVTEQVGSGEVSAGEADRVMASRAQAETKPHTARWRARVILLLVWTGSFSGLMAYEWTVWPNGSFLFGPFWFIRLHVMDRGELCISFVAFLMLFLFPLKPTVQTFIVFVSGVLLWCFLGMVAWGIAC
jgi:hypothetical protein